MTRREDLGGIIHSYQQYDPARFPSPTSPPPDLVSPALEHRLRFGGMRQLTEAELARAIHIDPTQIQGLGPSLDALIELLQARKQEILTTYETDSVQTLADRHYRRDVARADPPRQLHKRFAQAARDEQIRDLERLWYQSGDRSPFARRLVRLIASLSDKYQVEQLAARYPFTGRTGMNVPKALAIKEELEKIDALLKQLEEAATTAQIGLVDLEALAEFATPNDIDQLNALRRQIEEYLREMAERQGLQRDREGYRLTPKAHRLFQGRLLERIFGQLQPSRTGRHQGAVVGEGAVERQRTQPYQFGDSVTHMDIPGTLINALVRSGPGLPIRIKPEDIQVHQTRNTPKCATSILMDMSGSMRYDGQYINVKRMALALLGLIQREYPGDRLHFIEMATFAKQRRPHQIVDLLPKPVTLSDPVVQLRADMSREEITEFDVPPHFTNIQHALAMARQLLAPEATPNRQIILITDGLPTAHFEAQHLYLLYPPHPRTAAATLREGHLCRREGITINVFLLPSWSQDEDDIRFAYQLAESSQGRVFFTAGHDLDRYVVWDYLQRRRDILA
jgi:uncharacterized protein with von Willebrand factor type A (vWA) domain